MLSGFYIETHVLNHHGIIPSPMHTRKNVVRLPRSMIPPKAESPIMNTCLNSIRPSFTEPSRQVSHHPRGRGAVFQTPA